MPQKFIGSRALTTSQTWGNPSKRNQYTGSSNTSKCNKKVLTCILRILENLYEYIGKQRMKYCIFISWYNTSGEASEIISNVGPYSYCDLIFLTVRKTWPGATPQLYTSHRIYPDGRLAVGDWSPDMMKFYNVSDSLRLNRNGNRKGIKGKDERDRHKLSPQWKNDDNIEIK